MALANITNNILTDSGVLVGSLLTTSSAASTYVPYAGATGAVDLGTNDLSSRYLNANGSAGLGGVLHLKQDATYLARGNGYSSIASTNALFDFFGYTGASTYKNFAFRFDSLTNNTQRTYTLPDASGTLALTSSLSGMVTGTGTTNYLPKFTGASTIGNSQIFDDGTNVGIGNATPSRKLDVSGSGRFTGDLTVANSSRLFLNGSTGQDWALRTNSSTANFEIVDWSSTVARIIMTPSGNLGLGVTPSAWSLLTALQISGGAILAGYGGATYLGQNFYYGSGGDTYISNGYSTRYTQFNGQHLFFTAPSGTAGNTISFTQAMTLNASGNLSIGNTNDTYKLDVSGNTRILSSNGVQTIFGGATSFVINSIKGGLTAGNAVAYLMGLENSYNNQMTMLFNYAGYGSTSNYLGLGFYGQDNLFKLYASGAATFSSSVTADGLLVLGSNSSSTPFALGTSTPKFQLMNGGVYGLVGDVLTNGSSYLQSQRNDGNTTAYNLLLQPLGGNVGIGTTSPTATLHVNGTIQTSSPSSGSAQPWKLGSYAAGGTGTATGVIYIEVNGQIYSIPALLGTP